MPDPGSDLHQISRTDGFVARGIDYTARLLRPTAMCQRVAERGMAVIEAVYPDAIGDWRST
jgi:hypothetical protein